MKTFLRSIFITILFVSTAFPQWMQTNGPGTQVRKFLSSNSEIYAGTLSGVFVSMTNGDNWIQIGLSAERISSLTKVGPNMFAGTYDNGIFYSSNNGSTWEQRNNGLTSLDVRCLCFNASGIFAGTFGGGIFHTTNNGLEWINPSVDTSVSFTSDIVPNGIELYAAGILGLFKSLDNGTTWNNIGFTDPIFRLLVHGTDIFAPVGNAILNNTTLYVSHNNGISWDPVITVNDVVSDIVSIGPLFYFSTLNNLGVYKSSNNGLIWTPINDGFSVIPLIDCLGIHNNYLFAGSTNAWRRILDSPLPVEISSFTSNVNDNDVMLNWTTISEINNSGFEIQRGVFDQQVTMSWLKVGFVNGSGTTNITNSYEFMDKNLIPNRYLYRLKQIDYQGNFEYHYLSNNIEIGYPGQNKLSQNYPNPFNPNTVISFDLKQSGLVKINIYNIDGKQIFSLVNKILVSGSYSVNVDGNNLSSGTYFYSLNVDGMDLQVKRMILIK